MKYWAVTVHVDDKGQDFATMAGPFNTAAEQMAFVRAQRAIGKQVYWLDRNSDDSMHIGRVTVSDDDIHRLA